MGSMEDLPQVVNPVWERGDSLILSHSSGLEHAESGIHEFRKKNEKKTFGLRLCSIAFLH